MSKDCLPDGTEAAVESLASSRVAHPIIARLEQQHFADGD